MNFASNQILNSQNTTRIAAHLHINQFYQMVDALIQTE